MMMLRIFSAAALVAVAQAGLTADYATACPGTVDVPVNPTGLCRFKAVRAKVALEVADGTDASGDYAAASDDYAAASDDYAAETANYAAATCIETATTPSVPADATACSDVTVLSDTTACDAVQRAGTSDGNSPACTYTPLTGTAQVGTAVVGTAVVGTAEVLPTAANSDSCWSCAGPSNEVFEAMVAGNTAGQIELANALTVMTPTTAANCSVVCGLGPDLGPIEMLPVGGDGFDMSNGMAGALPAGANWCGEWSKRELDAASVTCATSIFDAKGLLFLTIIGGALCIIFFQCSIMAIVALVAGSKDQDDAKP